MSDMKRCIDCKHAWWPEMATGNAHVVDAMALCRHPNADLVSAHVSLVTGARYVRCADMRSHLSVYCCEPGATLFEPRKRDLGM